MLRCFQLIVDDIENLIVFVPCAMNALHGLALALAMISNKLPMVKEKIQESTFANTSAALESNSKLWVVPSTPSDKHTVHYEYDCSMLPMLSIHAYRETTMSVRPWPALCEPRYSSV